MSELADQLAQRVVSPFSWIQVFGDKISDTTTLKANS